MAEEQKIIPEFEVQVLNQNPSKILAKNTLEDQLMPDILVEIMSVLKDLHPNASFNCRFNILLAKIAQMIGFRRVKFKEYEHSSPHICNHYAINFMSSGGGKDRIVNDIDLYILKNYIEYFKSKAKDYKIDQERRIEQKADELYSETNQKGRKKDYIQNEREKLRDLCLEINQATPEGFFADAEAIDMAGFASLFVKLAEFGMFLQKGKQDNLLFFDCLFEAYDGKIPSKSTKYDRRKASLENITVNALLHSDPTVFIADTQKYFMTLMRNGLARRSHISFQVSDIKIIEPDPQKALYIQEQAYLKAKELGEKLFKIFINVPPNATYKLSTEAFKNVFYPYIQRLAELFNHNDLSEVIGKEILSRELKSLKLACIYACLNHPENLIINETDFKQAIASVEKLSSDLPKFLAYNPENSDQYERLFLFLRGNLGISFRKTQLVNLSKQFNVKRKDLRDKFNEYIEKVSELALENGYCLHPILINNNSGIEITLVKQPEQPEISEFQEVGEEEL
jgi:hypothetical protein